jgi:NAD(P)-dependent dehydrogenase (short-subunit alcohol dehydrogenase family)
MSMTSSSARGPRGPLAPERPILSHVRTVLVTGVSQGFGLHLARYFKQRGFTVVGLGLAASPENPHLDAYERVDLARLETVPSLVSDVEVDVLVNNASVYLDDPRRGYGDFFALAREDLRITYDTNVVAAAMLAQHVGRQMLARGTGRVVNVSSGMGRLRDADGEAFAYRSSKTALNSLTLTLARHFERAGTDLSAFSYCPGWIRTSMGTPTAPNLPEPTARSLVELSERGASGTNGRFFRGLDELGWDLDS